MSHLLGLRNARLQRRLRLARRREKPDLSDAAPSGTTARGGYDLTFRELHHYALGKMLLWDQTNPSSSERFLAQIKADPHYEPIGEWPSAIASPASILSSRWTRQKRGV